jgi:squalene-hopene/tetraprenyl-beta-curcumene cyclase
VLQTPPTRPPALESKGSSRKQGRGPVVLTFLTAGAIVLSSARADAEPLADDIDRLLVKARGFLLSQQDDDGAFRSKTYGHFKDGRALSPIALSALLFVPPGEPRLPSAYRKGADFVAALVDDRGKVEAGPFGLEYPVYATAGALLVLSVPANQRHARAKKALVEFLWEHQLDESNGWSPKDPAYGGWGYFNGVPKKPKDAHRLSELLSSNVSSTLFAAGALTLAGVPRDHPRLKKALVFIERCQNFGEGLDGGFFFTPSNEVQNKAGFLEKDPHGAFHYKSYGTMTADGLRALLRLGKPSDDPRVQAALRWLDTRFALDKVPGDYPREREVSRDGAYYYYLWTYAHAMMELGIRERWPAILVAELAKRQKPDGSWANPSLDMREDDPLVATSLAMGALGVARWMVTTEFRTSIPMD